MSILRRDEWTLRYRVIDVSPGGGDSAVFSREVREFRSWRNAEACKERWINEGRLVAIQRGIIRWMGDEEIVSEMDRLTKEGSVLT